MGRTIALACLLVAVGAIGQAQAPVLDARLATFLTELQRAAHAGDRQAIAAMVRYPLTVSIAGLRVPVADAAAFLDRYDDIFTEALRSEIARASVEPQPGRTPIATLPDGAAIGPNIVVLNRVNGRLQVVSIAVPPSTGAPTAAVETGRAPAHSQEPRRVAIRIGPRPTQVAGSLAVETTDSFIVFVAKGQTLGVRLERAPAGAAVVRVVHGRTGATLSPTIAEGRFVSGRATEGADYRIEVRRLADADSAPLPYMLSLTLR